VTQVCVSRNEQQKLIPEILRHFFSFGFDTFEQKWQLLLLQALLFSVPLFLATLEFIHGLICIRGGAVEIDKKLNPKGKKGKIICIRKGRLMSHHSNLLMYVRQKRASGVPFLLSQEADKVGHCAFILLALKLLSPNP
jgi:hypothetical protein